jgi:ATP-dependent helicase/nuclease subunit A
MATADSRGKLTPQQRLAVETTDVCVALSAGAGCGKTSVLTERFLSHLEPTPGDDGSSSPATQLGRIVAITFTERAAREMRDRIRSEVRKRLLAADDERDADHWLQLLRRLESAQISTIHSFCGTLLRRYAVEAGLDPRYALLEPTAADTIVAELIDDELRRLLSEQEPSLMDLMVDFGLGGVQDIVSYLMRERYRFRFDDWTPLAPAELVARWQKFQQDELPAAIAKRLHGGSPLRRILRLAAESPPPHETHAERVRAIVECAAALLTTKSPGELLAAMRENATIKGGPRSAWEGCEELKAEYQSSFGDLRKVIDKLEPLLNFDAAAALPAARTTLQFIRLTAPIAAAYETQKRQNSQLDFDDLLVETRNLLCGPAREALRKRVALSIERLLVDECQDTDPLQRELIEALVDDRRGRAKLFLVGDFKQSIYRFRRADPQVFHNWRAQTDERGRLPLGVNFRSQPAILDFVNALFADAFGDDEISRYEPLHAFFEQTSPTPAIEFLWATPEIATPDEGEPAEAAPAEKLNADVLRAEEAEWIARRIRALVDAREPRLPHKGGPEPLRPVEYGDVAILFRALSDAAIYENALERHGVPYYVVGGKAFYNQQEIFDLLNFLRVLDSTCDDVALAGVLRSPFFSLRDDTLFLLAQHSGGLAGGLFAPLLSDDLKGDERRRAEFAAATIEELRDLKNRLSITALLNEILARTAYDAVLTAEFLGERKLANLRKLVDMARTFDQSNVATLADFITWLDDAVAEQPNEAPAAIHAEKSPVVRLMTIHQSKGLEFPVVIVPDLQRKSNDRRGRAAFDPRLGPMVAPAGDDDAVTGLDLFRFVEQEQDEAESVRLFYVAVTRAADYLILAAGIDPEREPTGWREFLGERFDLENGTLLRPRVGQLPKIEIAVTVTKPAIETEPSTKPRRPDWTKLIEAAPSKGRKKAAGAASATGPVETAAIPPRAGARRRFSFSRELGLLKLARAEGEDEAERPGRHVAAEHEGEASGETTAVATGTELGTLVHGVLATIDFARPGDVARAVRRQLQRLQLDEDAEQAAAWSAEATTVLERFLKSSRAQAIAAAPQLYREMEFLLSWPLDRPPTPDSPYLQGFLDCLYEDAAGRLHLVDYKSHREVRDAAVAAERYRSQLSIYALAVERILGRAPDELVVCFLQTGAEHTFKWNAAVRRDVVDSITGALSELRP